MREFLNWLEEFECTKGTCAAGVNNTLRDALMVEAVDLMYVRDTLIAWKLCSPSPGQKDPQGA